MFSSGLEFPATATRSMVLDPPLTDDEFERLGMSYDLGSVERTKEGAIIVHAPAGGSTSSGNSEIARQLGNWWIQHRRGRIYDSSAGFFLPDGSVLSPDAAYAVADQLDGLSRDQLAGFLRLAPAFVIELRSPSDSMAKALEKMATWIANGVELGWLLDPYARQVHIYQPNVESRVETGSKLAGSGPIAGFVLDLEEVWRCYE